MSDKSPDKQVIIYFRLPSDLLTRLDALTERLDKEKKAANKGPGKVSVKRTNVLKAAVRQYVEREEAIKNEKDLR